MTLGSEDRRGVVGREYLLRERWSERSDSPKTKTIVKESFLVSAEIRVSGLIRVSECL